jgi:hypothetical protein
MFASPQTCGSILLSLRGRIAHVDGSSTMRPGKMSRRFRRRVVIIAATIVALGAVAVGTHAAMAVEVTWGAPASSAAISD